MFRKLSFTPGFWVNDSWCVRIGTLVVTLLTAIATRLLVGSPFNDVSFADNALLTISMITREALLVLENQLTFTKRVNRQYDSKFGVDGAKIGTTVNVRKPPQYTVSTGQALQIQDAVETQVPVTLDQQLHIGLQFSSQDLALSIDDFSSRFIAPAVAAIANRIDQLGMELYATVNQVVGTAGTVPTDLFTYLQAKAKLDDQASPNDNRRAVVINPTMEITLVNALKGLFQQSSAIASQYEKGEMGRAAGFTFYMDQNTAVHTVGPQGGVPLVNLAGQTGSSVVTDGWTAAAAPRLFRGDIITFDGVFAVNPQNRRNLGYLAQFVVTADVDSDGAGNATIPISPAIVTSGAFQNVTASPANNAAVNVFGAAGTISPQGLAFHPDAFTLACADLPLPENGVVKAARAADPQLGLSIRMIQAYDVISDQFISRLDVLIGWAALRADKLAVRIAA